MTKNNVSNDLYVMETTQSGRARRRLCGNVLMIASFIYLLLVCISAFVMLALEAKPSNTIFAIILLVLNLLAMCVVAILFNMFRK